MTHAPHFSQHGYKKREKIDDRRGEAAWAKATHVHVVRPEPTTYAQEKIDNRALGVARKEARQTEKAIAAATLPPGMRWFDHGRNGEFVRHCPYARRRGGRNRAHLRSARGYQKAAMRKAGNEAHRAQRTIERVFQDKAGMSWNDIGRALKDKGWSWRNVNNLAMHKGIGPDLAMTLAVEKQKEAA